MFALPNAPERSVPTIREFALASARTFNVSLAEILIVPTDRFSGGGTEAFELGTQPEAVGAALGATPGFDSPAFGSLER